MTVCCASQQNAPNPMPIHSWSSKRGSGNVTRPLSTRLKMGKSLGPAAHGFCDKRGRARAKLLAAGGDRALDAVAKRRVSSESVAAAPLAATACPPSDAHKTQSSRRSQRPCRCRTFMAFTPSSMASFSSSKIFPAMYLTRVSTCRRQSASRAAPSLRMAELNLWRSGTTSPRARPTSFRSGSSQRSRGAVPWPPSRDEPSP